MKRDEQLQAWLKGRPIHNNDLWIVIEDYQGNFIERQKVEGGECCPDFSCCNPKLLWPEEVRRTFVEGDAQVRHQLSMMALQQMAIDLGCEVRIGGDGSETLQ